MRGVAGDRRFPERRYPARTRQFAAASLLLLAACGGWDLGGERPDPRAGGFFGAVAGDEPRATLTARTVLVEGGNAVDAVVAYLFTAAVTFPSSASLGGGGVCLVYDPATDRADTIEFLAGRSGQTGAERSTAVPGMARGLYALSSRYGRFRQAQLVAPAELLARFGHPASRALAADVALVGPPLLADPALRSVLANRDGRPIAPGDEVVQLDLAATLAQIRTRGVGELYGGALGRRLSDGVPAVGGSLALEELRAYAPRWTGTAAIPVGYRTLHTPPLAGTAAIAALELFRMAEAEDRYAGADAVGRAHLVAEATLRVQADRVAWSEAGDSAALADPARIDRLMAGFDASSATDPAALARAPRAVTENPAGTSVVAASADGMAAACVVTMNNLFGAGRMAPGLGILLAAPPPPQPASLVPAIVVNHNTRQVIFVGAASGGLAAAPALAITMAEAMLAERPLAEAIATRRVLHVGEPNVVVVEAGLDPGLREGLARRGHALREVPELGRVAAIYCWDGLVSSPETCSAATDPRGFGYAVGN